MPPAVTDLLEQVQVDHTPVDVVVVDEQHRMPIGRRYLTVAIDVASRCVVGLVVTLEAHVGNLGRAVPGARGLRQAAVAGAVGGGGSLADERQGSDDMTSRRSHQIAPYAPPAKTES
ncbi:hypothetical protein TNCT6_77080 [Streptomyces sp. 6-11-2]|nr:hypothetical protein TNCT6_77080 [Streptomyces sp. 6-11-2]